MRVPCRGEALDSKWTIFPKHKSRLYSVTAYRSALVSHEGGSIFATLLSSGSTLKRPPCLAKNETRRWSSHPEINQVFDLIARVRSLLTTAAHPHARVRRHRLVQRAAVFIAVDPAAQIGEGRGPSRRKVNGSLPLIPPFS